MTEIDPLRRGLIEREASILTEALQLARIDPQRALFHLERLLNVVEHRLGQLPQPRESILKAVLGRGYSGSVKAEDLWEDSERLQALPEPLAKAFSHLKHESEHSGEHTTADELVEAIEATLCHLGRIWVAEYLHNGAPEDEINAELNTLLERTFSIGAWVGLARRIRAIFVERGFSTVTTGLAKVDFGERLDQAHLVAKLIIWRNAFGHGSMRAGVKAIREHRKLLLELLLQLPSLWDCPVCVRDPASGHFWRATGSWSAQDDVPKSGVEAGHPYLQGEDGQTLDLYPLYHLKHTESDNTLHLVAGSGRDQVHSLSDLTKRQALSIWLERYQKAQAGHVNIEKYFAKEGLAPPPAIRNAISNAIKDSNRPRVVLKAHPGCAVEGLVPWLKQYAVTELAFDRVVILDASPGVPTRSGVCSANVILRQIEEELVLQSEYYGHASDGNLGRLDRALADLNQSEKRWLVLIFALHHGMAPLRNEPLRVLDVQRKIGGGSICSLSVVWPGHHGESVFTDRVLEWPVPTDVNRAEVEKCVESRCRGEEGALQKRVLEVVREQGSWVDVFAVCDALDAKAENGDAPVFEPRVEQALHALRPVLMERRDEISGQRCWRCFMAGRGM